MKPKDPLERPKSEYTAVIDRIKADSNVGIDEQYTHAIIIEYLQQLDARLGRLEKLLEQKF